MRKNLVTILLAFFTLTSWAQFSMEERLASQYFQTGEFEKAADLYQKLFNQYRNSVQFYDNYFNSLIKTKRYEDAEKLVKKMMSVDGENYNYQVDFGKIQKERGDQEKANALYDKLLKKLPADEFRIRELSISFYRAEAFDFSIKTLLAGRDLLKDETAFSFDLLALYRYQKNKPMLVQEYINLFSKNPEPLLINQAKSTFANLFESADDYGLLKSALLKKLQKDPQNIVLVELLAWQFIQQREFDLALKQTISLDKRLKEDGERVYNITSLLFDNKAYDQAIIGLEYIINKGPDNPYHVSAKILLLNTKYQLLISNKYNAVELVQLEKEYQELLDNLGRKANTISAIRQLANLKSTYLNNAKGAATLLEQALTIPGLTPNTIGQIKLDLGDIYILAGEVWEANLIYGQAEKQFANDLIGQEAKFRNAKLSYYQGDFIWAKAQLSVLKSSTSQLIANDALNLELLINENTESQADSNALRKYAKADFLIFNQQFDKALKTLDSINVLFPANSLQDDILLLKAKVFQKQNMPEKAIEQLQAIEANYSFDLWGDDALFMMAEIFENELKNPTKASEYYQKLITNFPGSLYVAEARKRYRDLRGDNIG